MLSRRLQPIIEATLERLPGLVLLGPRQVGKTTLAHKIAARRGKAGAIYLDLERPLDMRRLHDADAFLRAQAGKLVVIDEITTGRDPVHRSAGGPAARAPPAALEWQCWQAPGARSEALHPR
ncbi:MAG: AAA family ATPase [Pseudomonadota bacterium]